MFYPKLTQKWQWDWGVIGQEGEIISTQANLDNRTIVGLEVFKGRKREKKGGEKGTMRKIGRT